MVYVVVVLLIIAVYFLVDISLKLTNHINQAHLIHYPVFSYSDINESLKDNRNRIKNIKRLQRQGIIDYDLNTGNEDTEIEINGVKTTYGGYMGIIKQEKKCIEWMLEANIKSKLGKPIEASKSEYHKRVIEEIEKK